MEKLPPLDAERAELLNTLFSPMEKKNFDLVALFQSWRTKEIELSPAQAKRTHDAIKQEAIPKAEELVRRSRHQPIELREDSERRLVTWKNLQQLFARVAAG